MYLQASSINLRSEVLHRVFASLTQIVVFEEVIRNDLRQDHTAFRRFYECFHQPFQLSNSVVIFTIFLVVLPNSIHMSFEYVQFHTLLQMFICNICVLKLKFVFICSIPKVDFHDHRQNFGKF